MSRTIGGPGKKTDPEKDKTQKHKRCLRPRMLLHVVMQLRDFHLPLYDA